MLIGDIVNRLVDTDLSTTTVNTTASETTLTTLSIPTQGLASGYVVRAVCGGDLLNNTGSPDTFLFKVKVGTTAVLTTPAISVAASANRRKWRLVVDVAAASDSTQRVLGSLDISEALTADFALSDWSADAKGAVGYGTGAETGTDQLDVTVTITLGSSSANLEATHKLGILEAIR